VHILSLGVKTFLQSTLINVEIVCVTNSRYFFVLF